MKKSKLAYFLFPILGLVIFVPIYLNYAAHYDAHVAELAAQKERDKQALLDQQNEQRKRAVDEAVAETKRRAEAKRLKDEAEAKRQQEMQELASTRSKVHSEQEQIRDKVNRLTDSVKVAQDEVDKVKAQEAKDKQEQSFIEQYIAKAQANVKNLNEVMQKIIDADAAAEAARAAAAKKS
jgi:chromosome segregation ATPase